MAPLVLTVCLGNICRSPTAEAALVEAAGAAAFDLRVRSAGTSGWNVGSPPEPRQAWAAAAVGLPLSGTAARLSAYDLAEADLVLAMDRANLAEVRQLAEQSGASPMIRLLRSYDPVSVAAGQLEVADPYHGGPHGFTVVVEQCRAAAVQVVAALAGHRPHPPA